MASNYDVNYDDQRFVQVEAQKQTALSDLENTYAGMINNSDKYYQAQIDASKEWADKQAELQQEKTDFAIEKIEQQKQQTQKDYTKEQSGAYVDWQKQSNQYGANAEAMAAQGMAGSGYSESSQVGMYNTYQNRVATAREVYNQAVLNYNNSITEARLQNNSLLAEIAYNALQQQLELSLQGFQYKNQLILDKTAKKLEVDQMYYNRYQDVLAQINHENALAEQIRQYNESLAEERRQFDVSLAEEQRQFNAQQAAKSSGGGGGIQGGSLIEDVPVKKTTPMFSNEYYAARIPKKETEKVNNQHGDSWVYIPGQGRFSWEEVYAYVENGTIKETKTNGGLTYTWVGKKTNTSKNVTSGNTVKQKGTAQSGRML